MNRDVDRAAGFLQGFTVTTIFKFFVLVTGSAIVLFKSNWRMALISIVLSVSSFLVTTLINPRDELLDMDAQQATADAASNLQELSNGLPVVQIFGLQKYLKEKFEAVCTRILSKQIKSRLFYGLNEMIIFITSFSAQPISFIIGIFLVSRGELTIDELVLLSGYAGVMAEGMRNLSMFLKFIQNSLVSAQRAFNLLDTPVEEEGVTLLPPDLSAENAIVIEKLCFSYPNNSRVIDNLSFEIKNGETVGIVGASGSGKTTLLNLLQAIYLPKSDIRLFNRSIRELSLKVSVLFQLMYLRILYCLMQLFMITSAGENRNAVKKYTKLLKRHIFMILLCHCRKVIKLLLKIAVRNYQEVRDNA